MVLRLVRAQRSRGIPIIRRSLFLVSLTALISTPASGEIGRIKSSSGVAVVQRGTERLPAATGQELLPGDWLETGKDGRISLTFVDNTRFAVGPDTRIALSKFEYNPTTQKGSFVAKVERGSIAVVTGRITKTRCDLEPAEASSCGMQVETPDSVIDAHGTRFIVTVRR
jgi:hypothetical protein